MKVLLNISLAVAVLLTVLTLIALALGYVGWNCRTVSRAKGWTPFLDGMRERMTVMGPLRATSASTVPALRMMLTRATEKSPDSPTWRDGSSPSLWRVPFIA